MQNQYFNIKTGVTNLTSSDGNQYFNVQKSSAVLILEVNSGTSGSFIIQTGSGYTFNYKVKTSDNQIFTNQTGDLTITFPNTNMDYFIEISGRFPYPYFPGNATNRDKILRIIQFGDVIFESLLRSFQNCSNLSGGSLDSPKLSQNISCTATFASTKYNGKIDEWDWSKISRAKDMLSDNRVFNQNLSYINLSNLSAIGNYTYDGLSHMINGARSFDNLGQRLVWDLLGKNFSWGVYPLNYVLVTEYEFQNAQNLNWSLQLQSGGQDRARVEVLIFGNFNRNLGLLATYPNLTTQGVKETVDAVDRSAGKIITLTTTVYNNFETHLQGLGYVNIQDYLTQTGNTWTITT